MKILLIESEKAPRTMEIDGSLASIQALVGGMIQAIYPFSQDIALVCNDLWQTAGSAPEPSLEEQCNRGYLRNHCRDILSVRRSVKFRLVCLAE